jgi:hypothetical protein
MNADKTKKTRKQAVNLSLSVQAVKMGNRLKKQLRRPSLTNVIEYLIEEAAGANKGS